MPRVMIDGIEYVPKGEVPELTDVRMKTALEELTSMFHIYENRNRERCVNNCLWGILNALAPEIAKLVSENPKAAYDRIHGTEDETDD